MGGSKLNRTGCAVALLAASVLTVKGRLSTQHTAAPAQHTLKQTEQSSVVDSPPHLQCRLAPAAVLLGAWVCRSKWWPLPRLPLGRCAHGSPHHCCRWGAEVAGDHVGAARAQRLGRALGGSVQRLQHGRRGAVQLQVQRPEEQGGVGSTWAGRQGQRSGARTAVQRPPAPPCHHITVTTAALQPAYL